MYTHSGVVWWCLQRVPYALYAACVRAAHSNCRCRCFPFIFCFQFSVVSSFSSREPTGPTIEIDAQGRNLVFPDARTSTESCAAPHTAIALHHANSKHCTDKGKKGKKYDGERVG